MVKYIFEYISHMMIRTSTLEDVSFDEETNG